MSFVGTTVKTQVQLLREVDKVDVEFRFVCIPDAWRAPKEGMFEKETMQSLADLGESLGRDPASWMSDLRNTPGLHDQHIAGARKAGEGPRMARIDTD